MKKSFLKSVLEVPTVSGKEHHMKAFILDFAKKNDVTYVEDAYGNVYLFKGIERVSDTVPCVVAHMDTVQEHEKFILGNKKLNIIEDDGCFHTDDENTGVGGDDKAGVAIALDIISKKDVIMGVFTKEEEIGCIGAKHLDDTYLSMASYIMEFDAPTDNWISKVSNGVQLFDDKFHKQITPLLKKYNQTRVNDNDPFTDIHVIKNMVNVNCINIFAGYYAPHSPREFVNIKDVQKAARFGSALITKLGTHPSIYQDDNK